MRPSLSGFLPVTSLVQYLKLCDCQWSTIKRQDQSDPVTAWKQKYGEKNRKYSSYHITLGPHDLFLCVNKNTNI